METTHFFYISNTFISNARLKLAKDQAKAKQHPESERLLFENYSLSLSRLSPKNNRRYSKKCTKNKCVCFNEVIWLMTMKVRLKMKSRSHRYDINRTKLRHGHKYSKYKMWLSMIMLIAAHKGGRNCWVRA